MIAFVVFHIETIAALLQLVSAAFRVAVNNIDMPFKVFELTR